jgi:hypothetical protein
MSSTTITIIKFNGMNYAQWATETAILLVQKEVYGIIKGLDGKLEEPTANATATENAAFKDWMNRHGVARSTILLGMEPRIHAEYTVVDDAKKLREKLASAYKSKLKLNIFEIREDLWSMKLQDWGDVDNYASRIDQKVKDYNLCAGPSITDAPKMTRKCDWESCIKCKFARKHFTPNTTSRPTVSLQLMHLDICGPLDTAIGGDQYVLLFINDATRHTDEYILKYKSEALEKFKEWKALREKESGKQVKRFRTDGGGEYTSKKFVEYLKSEGIIKETTTPYSPQSNGVVERANRTIMERVRCRLANAGHSKTYRSFAVSVVVYLKNCTPTRSVVGKTPY